MKMYSQNEMIRASFNELDHWDEAWLTAVDMNITHLSSTQLRQAATIKDQIDRLQAKLNGLLGGAKTQAAPTKRRKISAAVRAKMAAAARARWAKIKAKKK